MMQNMLSTTLTSAVTPWKVGNILTFFECPKIARKRQHGAQQRSARQAFPSIGKQLSSWQEAHVGVRKPWTQPMLAQRTLSCSVLWNHRRLQITFYICGILPRSCKLQCVDICEGLGHFGHYYKQFHTSAWQAFVNPRGLKKNWRWNHSHHQPFLFVALKLRDLFKKAGKQLEDKPWFKTVARKTCCNRFNSLVPHNYTHSTTTLLTTVTVL